jgi:hypothetical protein
MSIIQFLNNSWILVNLLLERAQEEGQKVLNTAAQILLMDIFLDRKGCR